MLVGLQGSGKTTTTAKMAKYFKDRGMKLLLLLLTPGGPQLMSSSDSLLRSTE